MYYRLRVQLKQALQEERREKKNRKICALCKEACVDQRRSPTATTKSYANEKKRKTYRNYVAMGHG